MIGSRVTLSLLLAVSVLPLLSGCSTVENESVIGEVIQGETDRAEYLNRVRETNTERTRQRADPNAPDRPDFDPEFGDPGYNPEL
ncbi:MAG: hypothetical protein ACFBZ8_06670 [Opitutales bacterium]